jgi:hypothetical protein
MTAEQINQALALSANVLRQLDAEQVQLFTSVLAHYNGHVHESSEDRLLCLANGCRAGFNHPIFRYISRPEPLGEDLWKEIYIRPGGPICPCCRR